MNREVGDQIINTAEGPITKIESGQYEGMYHIPHWLYGSSTFYNVAVRYEHNCLDCVHVRVCHKKMETLCDNYRFGTSERTMCSGCIHRYSRCDNKQQIPCFSCKEFKGIDNTLPTNSMFDNVRTSNEYEQNLVNDLFDKCFVE